MKKAIFLTEDLPFPPASGAKLRNWSIIRLLSERMKVQVLTFDSKPLPADSPEWVRGLEITRLPRTRTPLLRRALSPFMPYIVNGRSSQAAEIINSACRDGALIWIAKLGMAKYIADARSTKIAIVLDDHNVESDLWLRSALSSPWHWKELPLALQCLYHERRFARMSRLVVVTSEEDRARMLELSPRSNVQVLPNLIDVHAYLGSDPPREGRALFTGTLDYAPNIEGLRWFCTEVLPEYRKLDPGGKLRFRVAGARPSLEVRRLLEHEGVELVENPLSMLPLLHEARLCFVPLLAGGGTRLKILEALSAQRPVVSTAIGAEGLGLVDGVEFLQADLPGVFAGMLWKLVSDPVQAGRLARDGREAALRSHDWRAGRKAMDQILSVALKEEEIR